MFEAEETIGRLMKIRAQLTPLTERLLDIEARMEAAKEADHRPVGMSLRDFTAQLLGRETPPAPTSDGTQPQDRLVSVR
jgi:hypothetical protein